MQKFQISLPKRDTLLSRKLRKGDLLPTVLPLEHPPNVSSNGVETCRRNAGERNVFSGEQPIGVFPFLSSIKPTYVDKTIPRSQGSVEVRHRESQEPIEIVQRVETLAPYGVLSICWGSAALAPVFSDRRVYHRCSLRVQWNERVCTLRVRDSARIEGFL